MFAADVGDGEVRAVGAYLQGMPFHAFSLQLLAAEGEYDATDMLNYFRQQPSVDMPEGQTGVFGLPQAAFERVKIPGIRAQRTLQLMKLVAPDRLLAPGGSRLLAPSEGQLAVALAGQVGMISFRAEEVEEMPHIALFPNRTSQWLWLAFTSTTMLLWRSGTSAPAKSIGKRLGNTDRLRH